MPTALPTRKERAIMPDNPTAPCVIDLFSDQPGRLNPFPAMPLAEGSLRRRLLLESLNSLVEHGNQAGPDQ